MVKLNTVQAIPRTLTFRSCCYVSICLDLFSTYMGHRTCSTLICNASVQFQKKIRNITYDLSRSPKYAEFHVVDLQRTAKKRTKICNALPQPLFCSLKLSFFSVLGAVAVVVCSRSLLIPLERCSFASFVYLIRYPVLIGRKKYLQNIYK